MPPKRPDLNLYISLLEEAKVRALAIDNALSGQTRILKPFLREFCFLQLRFICEIIALACIVAHSDIAAAKSKKMRKSYSAHFIIKRLGTLHPKFYPVPTIAMRQGRTLHLKDAEAPYLAKGDLMRLYAVAGDELHHGSLDSVIAGEQQFNESLDDVREWLQKIVNLLSRHAIATLDDAAMIYCVWRAADHGGHCFAEFLPAVAP